MIFRGDFNPLTDDVQPLTSPSLSMRLRATHVRTHDPRTENQAALILTNAGEIEVSVKMKSVTKLSTDNQNDDF